MALTILAACLLLAAAVWAVWAATGDTDDDAADAPAPAPATASTGTSAAPSPSASEDPAPDPTDGGTASDDQGEPDDPRVANPDEGADAAPVVVTEHLEAMGEAQGLDLGPDDVLPAAQQEALEQTATGHALDAALAAAAEYQDNGWTQSGTPRVLRSEVIDAALSEDPPRVVLSACVDSSRVKVTDANGRQLRDLDQVRPTTNIFTLVFTDGRWRVTELTFPADPDC